MNIINGNKLSEEILLKLQNKIKINKIIPRLDIFQIGENFASDVYVEKKKNWGESIGVKVVVHKHPSLSESRLLELIDKANKNSDVHGIIVQLPLPQNIDKNNIFLSIWPEKDVDGLSPISLGALWQGSDIGFAPATPLGVVECLKHVAIFEDGNYSSDELDASTVNSKTKKYLEGKNILIINRSNIVGKPLAAILSNYNATVTIAHSKTRNLQELCLKSEIIISGTGKNNFITKEMIPQDAVLIDVGINSTAKGIGGDINYKGADSKIKWITPVPGGVGPLTVCMLLANTIKACEKRELDIS